MSELNPIKKRQRARKYLLQALYAWMISENDLSDVEKSFIDRFDAENYDISYFRHLFHQIPKNLQQLDKIFSPFLNTPIESLDQIELAILRIATYEICLNDEPLHYRIAINEALELAKAFGATDSHKFINGVLDKMAKSHATDG